MDTLMAITATFQVTNPRDAVYAIITLTKDARLPPNNPVDYNYSVAHICKDLIQRTIDEDGCLDVICRPWLLFLQTSLPGFRRFLDTRLLQMKKATIGE
jgi:hypothetical protein